MNTFVKLGTTLGLLACMSHSYAGSEAECPEFLNQEFKKLHSSKSINLCSLYNGKPMVIVNTASHCGFTKQFTPLEALHQKYKDQGIQVVGFASNDFNQEAKSEEEAAGICFKNYGVSFTMLAPTKVKGDDANPVFSHLAKESGEQPGWNFNKYVISSKGKTVTHYGSKKQPLGAEIEEEIKKELGS